MKVMKIGSLTWKQGLLSLNGWHLDLEGEEYSQRALEKAAAKCVVEIMLEDIGVDLESHASFEVERLTMDVIGYAAITSSPSMLREYELSKRRSLWERVTDWWLR